MHPSDEILEEYALHRLREASSAQVEEHLLICQSCREAVAETDRFVSALKAAARHAVPVSGPVLTGWRNSAPIAALVVLALLVVWKYPKETSAPVEVSIFSLRGVEPLSPAPAGKRLVLCIEAPDLISGQEYRVDVVDGVGGPVWTGTASDSNGKLIATMSKPLGNGLYWVRLYGANSNLLREFGLSAR